ncbi:arrestin domain-containing protein 3-like [Sphaeramia orbicularis]|uniref:arrestin domain-containing protein 3-like n=1 Tax=Sphaeramia orbicularis TaxID=375764 RepID=UPI00117BEA60|nr:arrestin domain-containing protein 3-like [Sphaeramia orbicularis]
MFESTFKNFSINFNALNERNTVSSGDILTGNITFKLTKETKISAITMKLIGKAHVHWSTSGGGGRKRRRHRRHFSAKLEFFDLKSVILKEDGALGGTTKLLPGTHVYPFTCQIPHGNFPTSFHGVHGKIDYVITVGISRPWHLSKDFLTELNFVNHINTNQPELWAPLSGHNSTTLCCLWCASGPIEFTATVEKKAFTPGETVKVICDISNASTRTATPKVKLLQKQSFFTHSGSRNIVDKTLTSQTGEPISTTSSDVHTEILIPIPPSAPLTISNCSILRVDYTIEASLCLSAAADVTVIFPIILYSIPTHNLLPQL